MDNRDDRLEAKIDKIAEHITSIDITLAKQHVSLKEHMRRSDALEKQLEPIKKHVGMMQGGLKLLGIMALVLGIISTTLKILGKI